MAAHHTSQVLKTSPIIDIRLEPGRAKIISITEIMGRPITGQQAERATDNGNYNQGILELRGGYYNITWHLPRCTVVDLFFCRPNVFHVFLSNFPNESGDFMSPTLTIFLSTSHA